MANTSAIPLISTGSRVEAPPPRQAEMTSAQAFDQQDDLMMEQGRSPAYRALYENHLINASFRKKAAADLDLVQPNATMADNVARRTGAYVAGCCVGGIAYDRVVTQFSVKDGHIRCGSHSNGEYLFYGAGVHRITSPFISVQRDDVPLTNPQIVHGTKAIVTIPQGFVGLATDRGQPVLLPPGLHQWASATMKFERLIDLSSPVINLGPYTLITVDQGYSAVTQDNGQQKVLSGGSAYMLTHRNWKFEKFITEKIQTNDLGPIRATTGDNVPLETTATVTWRIDDAALAARTAANTMSGGSNDSTVLGIDKLRNDVLKQATASLAAFIGSIRYSEGVHVSTKIQQAADQGSGFLQADEPAKEPAGACELVGANAIFDPETAGCAMSHANSVCLQYGVRIISINVISAFPADQRLMEALSAGAVAAAVAEQAETAARGNARAEVISAEADAQARCIRARGAADAARSLEAAGGVAVDIARIEKTGDAIKNSTNFFVAEGPAAMSAALLAGATGAAKRS